MHKKIKILHITSSLKIGGAETVLCQVISQLKNQFEHHVIYFHGGPNIKKLHDLGVRTYQIKGLFFLYDLLFFVRLFILIKQLSPNIIHSLLWAANISSRLASWLIGVPNISVYHNNIDQNGLIRNMIDKITAYRSDCIVAVSSQIEDDLKKSLRAKQMRVIKNGIDIDAIHRVAKKTIILKSDLGIANEKLIIGSVGRLDPIKNFPLLLKSFSLMRTRKEDVHLVIVGVGKEETKLRKLAYDLGISHNMTLVIGKQAYPYYRLFDLFVQSSDKEGISMALLEAMSFSVPCIVTHAYPIHPVIVNKENGIVVEASNEEQLSHAIDLLLTDRLSARTIGIHGRDTIIKNFSSTSMVQGYRRLFSLFANREL